MALRAKWVIPPPKQSHSRTQVLKVKHWLVR